MRQRFTQVLQAEETDDAQTDVLRRFWSRAKPLPARIDPRVVPRAPATVVDLAQWTQSRRVER